MDKIKTLKIKVKRVFNLKLKKLYYKIFHNLNVGGFNGTLLPKTGKGIYVSVYVKGKIIQIVDENNQYNEIRIIPYQPNHGVMVEIIKDGIVKERKLLDINQLNKNIIYASNVESLAKRNNEKNNKN